LKLQERSPDSQDLVRDSSQRVKVLKSFRKIGKKNFLAIYYNEIFTKNY
jgi:hypothetical protein